MFVIEVGEVQSSQLCVVDVWAAGKRLTIDDNIAYVPSLSYYMRQDANRVHRREIPAHPFPGRAPGEVVRLLDADETVNREQLWFMRWSEILDSVSIFAYLDGDLVVAFRFWRATHPVPEDLGNVFAVRIPLDHFVATVEHAADLLDAGLSR